mmetsp:Transcript_55969/g.164322  ORF Transcript_55969/g.164322 Transcript_55969/m.164322 type:complete len:211 (-) Transcript_55969:719-1351(-)
MCFSTCGFTRQNQQSAWGSMTMVISRFFFGAPSFRLLMVMVIFRPPTSNSSLISQAACASSGVEKVTHPKPLHGLPSAPSSRARCTRSILPMCFSAASMRRSSMFGGSLPRKTWSGTTSSAPSPPALPSMSSDERFRFGAWALANMLAMRKGFGVVFGGRCFSAVSGITAAGLRDRPWTHVRPLPLLPTLPSPMHRDTCPAFRVWNGGRW